MQIPKSKSQAKKVGWKKFKAVQLSPCFDSVMPPELYFLLSSPT
jgi:hypothetical protein